MGVAFPPSDIIRNMGCPFAQEFLRHACGKYVTGDAKRYLQSQNVNTILFL